MRVEARRDIPLTYIVVSGPEVYDCDLRDPFAPTCSCADFLWRDRLCKHLTLCQQLRDGETE